MVDLAVMQEELSKLTILEVAELTSNLEEAWGVSAQAAVAVAAGPAAGGDEPAAIEEQTEFAVHMTEVGGSKVPVIKEVRAVTGLGLKEAKALVDATPGVIKEGIDTEEAESIKAKLEAVGATIEIR